MSSDNPPPYTEVIPTEGDPPRRWLHLGRRQLIALGAVVVLAGAGIGIYEGTEGGGSSGTGVLTVSTEKVTVSTGTMDETVSASGTIEPTTDADLTFGVSGKVISVDVVAGQKVTKGQVLATLDSTALQDDVSAAQASLTAAEDRLSTDESASASTSQIDSDQAAVTLAQSQLSTAQTNLSDANLTSTINGTVASVGLSVGEVVSGSSGGGNSGSNSSGSSEGIVVVSTGSYMVDTSVDDTEVGEIQVGDQATITPSDSTTNVYGTVSSVGLVASSSGGNVASFPVDIAVTGSPSGLYAGASASVTITYRVLSNVTEVPTAAISYSNGDATVTEVKGGSDYTVAVTTGASLNGETQITSGLSPGDVIVERVVKFNGSGAARSILGGSTTAGNRTGKSGLRQFLGGGLPAGGFPAGGFPAGGTSGGATFFSPTGGGGG